MRRPKFSTPFIPTTARSRSADLGILALRLGSGGLMAAHGAQKLFGTFDGAGFAGTAVWLESMGLRPGKAWAAMAGLSEFGGGAMTALGLGGPVGPIALQGATATAARQLHWRLPIWARAGGPEMLVLYAVAGAALTLTGPGRYSLDRALGVKVPLSVALATGVGVAAGVALAEFKTVEARAAQPAESSTDSQTAGDDTVVAESTGPAYTPLENGASTSDDIAVTPSTDEATGSVAI